MFSIDKPSYEEAKRSVLVGQKNSKLLLILYCIHYRRKLSEAEFICLEPQDVSRHHWSKSSRAFQHAPANRG